MVMAKVGFMVHNALSGQAIRIVAGAVCFALSVGCTTQDISSQDISSQDERGQGDRGQGGRRPVWKGESIDGLYENSVDASMERDGSNVVVTCTLPRIQDETIRFDVEQISLRDVDQNEVAGVVRNPTLTMTLPETQLESLSVSVLYMDERAFTESVADPSLLVDWSVRMKTFRLIDVLRAP
jgi:hypothetical protein